jgi:hypothetical protein
MQVEDSLDCAAPHEVALRWHLAPECTFERQGDHFVISRDACDLVLEIDCGGGTIEVVSASEDAPDAWISRRFYMREPSRMIVARTRLGPQTRIATTMRFGACDWSGPGLGAGRNGLTIEAGEFVT